MRVWMCEVIVVAAVLATVGILVGHGPAGWLTASAVLVGFAYMQVAYRLAEEQGTLPEPTVECHRWARNYLVTKEILWALVFITTGLYPALVGCVLFLAYPVWRRWYRKWRRNG